MSTPRKPAPAPPPNTTPHGAVVNPNRPPAKPTPAASPHAAEAERVKAEAREDLARMGLLPRKTDR